MKIFYYTATGNSLYLARNLGNEPNSIPKVLKGKRKAFKDDSRGFVFPTYMMSLPKIVIDF